MAEKTFVDKAGETVGIGIAMTSDVAGAIKTAIDAAVTTVTEVLKTAPAKKSVWEQRCEEICDEEGCQKRPRDEGC